MNPCLLSAFTVTIPQFAACLLFVAAAVLSSQLALTGFQRWAGKHKLGFHNEVASVVFGCISLIYSLVLAFVVVAVWDDYNDLSKTIEEEADKLNSILAHTSSLSRDIQLNFDTAISNYCGRVVDEEWQMKGEDQQQPSAIPCLRKFLLTRPPRNEIEKNIFPVVDDDLSKISDLRRQRLGHSHSQMPYMVWFVLDGGTILLVLFFFFLSVPSLRLKRIYLAFLVGCVAMCMFLVYMLDHPFDDENGISNRLYRNIKAELNSPDRKLPCSK